MAACLAKAETPQQRVQAMLGFDAVIPPPLAADGNFRAALTHWVAILETQGALAALAHFQGER
jgi:fructuronate reductase